MKLVLVESPYAGDVERNLRYLRACMRDCLQRGEAPFASHALYTQPDVLNDGVPEERLLGITAGLEWGTKADATVVYVDLGISDGMQIGINVAHRTGRPVEERRLGGWPEKADPTVGLLSEAEWRRHKRWEKSPATALWQFAASARARVSKLLRLLAHARHENGCEPLRGRHSLWCMDVRAELAVGRAEGLIRRLDELIGPAVKLPPDEPLKPPILRAPIEDRPGNEAVNAAKEPKR